MARLRFGAAVWGAAVPSIKTIAAALAVIALATSLAGCAAAPGSFEEQLWFDKPVGPDVYQDTLQLRMHGIVGYPRTACCGPGPVLIEHP